MHGLIFYHLRQYAEVTLGQGCWKELLAEAGLGRNLYLANHAYPDADAAALVAATAARAKVSPAKLLYAFGVYLSPKLLVSYRMLIRSEWKTMEVLGALDRTIHPAVHSADGLAEPPRLWIEAKSRDTLHIVYQSHRRMCFFAEGLVEGLAVYYKQQVTIRHAECMHAGAQRCLIEVRLVSG